MARRSSSRLVICAPLGLPRRYGCWSRPSTVTVLCAAVPLNQWRQLRGALGVGVAAGVDDERAAVAVGLDAQQVVVAVAAVAERAAVEHQEALVAERRSARRPSRCAARK